MGRQTIYLGATGNDGTGDKPRPAGEKINENFIELYGATPLFDLTASEAITAGMFVNIHASSGAKVRKANATTAAKPVNGFAPAGIANAGTGTIAGPGTLITGLSGLTPGVPHYLSTVAGLITDTPPSGSGNLVQQVGIALSATALFFYPQQGIEL